MIMGTSYQKTLIPPLVQVVLFAYAATYDVTQPAAGHLER